MSWIEAGISALGSLVGSGLNSLFGQSQSKSLMRYQAQLQQQLIDKANQFNDPQNQMARLAAAGLSPNLVYGSGGVTGNQSETGRVSAVNRDAGIDLGVDKAVNTFLQSKLQEQQIKESQSREAFNQVKMLGQMYTNRFRSRTLDTSVKQAEQNLEKTMQSIREGVTRENLNTQKTSNLQSQANLLEEQIKLTQQKTNLTEKQVITEACRPEQLKASARYLREQATTTAKEREVMDTVIQLNQAKIEELGFMCLKISEDALYTHELVTWQRELNRFNVGNLTPKEFLAAIVKIIVAAMK